jgi:hypothetical protein
MCNFWMWTPGGSLYCNYTPCAFSGPLLRTACTESHQSIAHRYTPIAEQGTPFCRHTKMFKERTGQLFANTGSWRGVQPGRGTGRTLELRIRSLYINNFQKSKYWGPIAGACLFQGAYLFLRRPAFYGKNHPLNRKNWNAHG